MTAVFLQGNSRDVLKSMPSDFFHCAVTSPPYFGLRRYKGGEEAWDDGWKGQLGNEPSPASYISHLVQICGEVKRVLRPDGVFWLNIGDSWASGEGTCFNPGGGDSSLEGHARLKDNEAYPLNRFDKSDLEVQGMKPLDMVLIPSLLALALRADGWYVRSMVCWSKNNPMPESVNGWRWERHKVKVGDNGRGREAWQDCPGCPKCSPRGGYVLRKGSWRPTDSYEFILMLTKTDNYYCDREAVLERGVYPAGESRQGGDEHKSVKAGSRTTEGLHNKEWIGNGGRNLRSVWEFPTKPFKGAHFAVFPPRLPELCVKSSTSEKGCCPICGSPWARVVDKGLTEHTGDTKTLYEVGTTANRLALLRQAAREQGAEYVSSTSTIGWFPTCSCPPADPVPCRVLDPFSGAGTTALVCERLGLDSFSIDTSAEYIALSQSRLEEDEQKRVTEFIKRAKSLSRKGGDANQAETTIKNR